MLKVIRVVIAIIFFTSIGLFFCDFADVMPKEFKQLMRIQIVPAIVAGSLIVVAVLMLLTLFFGRVYCSTICPLGVLQDIIARFNGKGKRKNNKRRRYQYSKPQNYLRYGILALSAVSLIFGLVTPLVLLDPYSNFGRIATNLIRPLVMYGNNLVNMLALKVGNYDFYHVTVYSVTMVSMFTALVAFILVAVMSFLRGRLFCNTICPVGSLLGLLSRRSIFRVVMNTERCNGCSLCERACKSQCIDSKNMMIDSSRCVSCYNCLSRCRRQAIGYQFSWKRKLQPATVMAGSSQPDPVDNMPLQTGRRSFLLTGTAIAATIPLVPAWAQSQSVDKSKLTPITPPGSGSLKHFKERCTGCHLCVTHCPQQILKPAGFTFGLGYFLKPHLVYKHAYCNYECDICSGICPNGAILPFAGKKGKKTTQIGIAQFSMEQCVVYNHDTDCGACSEHCPTQAVRMLPYKGDLRLPHVTPELCIGCGGCEYICPVRPIRAINVIANAEHQISLQPEEEEIEQIEVDGFGF